MISFENVTKRYGTRIALDEVSFSLDAGDGVFGRSFGRRKIDAAASFGVPRSPSEGRVMVGNFDLRRLSASQLPMFRRKVGVVFQDLNCCPIAPFMKMSLYP